MSDHLEDHLKEAREDDCDSCGLSLKRIKALESSNAKLETLNAAIIEQETKNVAYIQSLEATNAKLTSENETLQVEARRFEGEWLELKKQAGKLAEALEHCRNRPHEHNPPSDFTMTHCEVIDRALAAFRAATEGKQ